MGGKNSSKSKMNSRNYTFDKNAYHSDHVKEPESIKSTRADVLPTSGYEPHFNPIFWNHFFDDDEKSNDIRLRNNCWMYAVNDFKHTGDKRSQPGHTDKAQQTFNQYSCSDMHARIKKDIPLAYVAEEKKKCKKYFYKIAVVVDPGNNYHFYRQDSNGLWSHKEGELPVTNLDATGNLIYNPKTANRFYHHSNKNDSLLYTSLCSFMCIPSNTFFSDNVVTDTCDQCGGSQGV